MPKNLEKVCSTVLRRVRPGGRERDRIRSLANKLEKEVELACEKAGIKATVRVEGSVAKDTWLSEEPDIDVFMRVPKTIPRMSLGEVCLKIAREATAGSKQIERFAEHPYLEAILEGTRVNIVPCYTTKPGHWQSATDRTPFHTDYIRKRLNAQTQSEVLLLKKFMKGIGVYGAEIKTGGFSGYLCELLVLHYGSLPNVLEAFAALEQRLVVDIEGYYANRAGDMRLLFSEPLVVVDPVDKGRNVASAVQTSKLHVFVSAARAFLKQPDLAFFYPRTTVALSAKRIERQLKKRGSDIVFLVFSYIESVPDVLWGQLYRSQRSLRKLVELSDFTVVRDAAWSDEKALNMFVLEVEQRRISSAKVHLGPPLEKKHECDKFLEKHGNNASVVSGPYIENGRWVVILKRKHFDVVSLLLERLKDGGKNAGVADQISKELRGGFRVLVNSEIVGMYKENKGFAKFLTEFLSGRPKWLDAC